MNPTFIRMAQLATTTKRAGRLPLHPNTIYRKVKAGEFPAPVKLGKQSTAWRMADIEQWEAETVTYTATKLGGADSE